MLYNIGNKDFFYLFHFVIIAKFKIRGSASAEHFKFDLVRNNNGQITQKTETLDNISVIYDYTYDDLGRLTEVKKDGAVAREYGVRLIFATFLNYGFVVEK